MGYSLAAKATIQDFVFVPDVTSQTGRGGEGALTLVTRKLLQSLHNTNTYGYVYLFTAVCITKSKSNYTS